ncbi:hypothetical protein [Paraburkholderia sp. J8-2]|uniref:hypothetical protein n=1 Tax=Paraburkholderia sp. J8-2 TaxID=2805440 RepID=UPI002AB66FB6|nr:hypothetical protein [Paraburkholderia sp. J8-2]
MHFPFTTTADLTVSEESAAASPESFLDIRQLRERGWTRQMVIRFLCTPDSMRAPALGRGGRPAELYDVRRVLQAERRVDFIHAYRRAPARSAMARESQRTRRDAVIRFASTLELSLPFRPLEVVRAHAIAAACVAEEQKPIDVGEQDKMLKYLLGAMDADAKRLKIFERQPGIDDARTLLRDRQIELIVWHYPELTAAARRYRIKEAMCPPEQRIAHG